MNKTKKFAGTTGACKNVWIAVDLFNAFNRQGTNISKVRIFGNDSNNNADDFRNNTITVLGILIGFSISVFTVLLTIDNEHIQKAKKEKLDDKKNKSVSLYDSILIGLAYLIIIQGFLLIYNFIYLFLLK